MKEGDYLMGVELLKDIKEELKELRVLYQTLVEKFLPITDPTKEEQKAIEEHDEIVDEKTLMTTLEQ